MAKVILISQFPLPFSGIGSWTTLYQNYIVHHPHQLHAIVCPTPDSKFDNVSYGFAGKTFWMRVRRKLAKKNYAEYINPLGKLVEDNQKYIIQIIDNQGIVAHVDSFLRERNIRQNVHIQFFYHGFSPFYNNTRSKYFFECIDELVLLTKQSYLEFKSYYTILPSKINILHNGIDTSKFYSVDSAQKSALKQKFGLSDKTVFVWCSQDRPKKGLDMILDAWQRVYSKNSKIVLLVIGCSRDIKLTGVQFLGKIPNDKLPEYYQVSDVYLFPTLCKEGFGMTLIEALHCGNYCIASEYGGVPEVLQNGRFGKLIANPHFVNEWVEAMNHYLENVESPFEHPGDLYSMQSWNHGMDRIIDNARVSLEQ